MGHIYGHEHCHGITIGREIHFQLLFSKRICTFLINSLSAGIYFTAKLLRGRGLGIVSTLLWLLTISPTVGDRCMHLFVFIFELCILLQPSQIPRFICAFSLNQLILRANATRIGLLYNPWNIGSVYRKKSELSRKRPIIPFRSIKTCRETTNQVALICISRS